jgi:hypothetical protein
MEMKKILALVFSVMLITPAMADGWRHHHQRPVHRNHYNWVAPVIIGGAVGYLLAQPRYNQQSVVITPPGTLPPPPYGYHYETFLDAYCNCYRTVLVLN